VKPQKSINFLSFSFGFAIFGIFLPSKRSKSAGMVDEFTI
jgi:hypothetical protein